MKKYNYNNIFFINEELDNSDIDDLYLICDYFISCARCEGQGRSFIEAQQFGKIAIGLNYSAIKEHNINNSMILLNCKETKINCRLYENYFNNSEFNKLKWVNVDDKHLWEVLDSLKNKTNINFNIKKNIEEYYSLENTTDILVNRINKYIANNKMKKNVLLTI